MQDQQQTGNLFAITLPLRVLSTLAHWTKDDNHNEKHPMSKTGEFNPFPKLLSQKSPFPTLVLGRRGVFKPW